jgi:NAD(P)-dependent dehydrogenase (short-subunit alcohol dehydrogenase family)
MPTPSIHAFAEKVAVLTDGSNPVGRAVAMSLALQGCYVIAAFPPDSTGNLNELQELGTLAIAVEADVSTAEGRGNLFETVENSFGRLDLLVNNAHLAVESNLAEMTEAIFDTVIRRNLKTTFFCCQSATRLMQNRSSAAVVNVIFEPENSLLAFTNSASRTLCKTLAETLAPKIRVNAVSFKAEQKQQSEFDLLRPPTVIAPDDVARAVIYLLAPDSKAIRGQIITVGNVSKANL